MLRSGGGGGGGRRGAVAVAAGDGSAGAAGPEKRGPRVRRAATGRLPRTRSQTWRVGSGPRGPHEARGECAVPGLFCAVHWTPHGPPVSLARRRLLTGELECVRRELDAGGARWGAGRGRASGETHAQAAATISWPRWPSASGAPSAPACRQLFGAAHQSEHPDGWPDRRLTC